MGSMGLMGFTEFTDNGGSLFGIRVFGILKDNEINEIKKIINNINLHVENMRDVYCHLNTLYEQFYNNKLDGFIIYLEPMGTNSYGICIQKIIPRVNALEI